MKKNNLILIIIGILLVGFIVYKLNGNKVIMNQKEQKAIADQLYDYIPVKTAKVVSKNMASTLSESGTFEAVQELDLTAQSQGQITKLMVKKSQFVRKGTLLALIDNSSLESQTVTAQAALDKAREDAKRYQNALAAGGVSKQQEEEAKLRVQSAESQLAALKQQSRNFQVIAPMDGVVNNIYAEAGSNVSAGAPLMEIVDITKVNLTVRIDQKNLPDIKLGQKVQVTTDVYANTIFDGKVTTVNVKTDLSQKIEVGITIDNSEQTPLLSGMYGHAEFVTNKKQKEDIALIIPRDAILGSIQDAKVFVLNIDSTVNIQQIVTGRRLDQDVEIISGLKKDQEVVTAGQINLENGTRVKVKN